MNILLTGAFSYTEDHIRQLKILGLNVIMHKNEKDALSFDPVEIDIVVCNGLFLYHNISIFENLKLIQLTSVGTDRVPMHEIQKRGIRLFTAKGVYSIPMAEWALSKVLDIYKESQFFYTNQEKHVWVKSRTLREINGTKVAIIGAGNIGSKVANLFKSLGAKVIGFDIHLLDNSCFNSILNISELHDRIEIFDIIIITLPLTPQTKCLFDYNLLSKISINAVLINIARGGIIVTDDLINFLKERPDVTVALDVFEEEPLNEKSPLWDMKNVLISPHNSFVSTKNSDRLFHTIYNNIKSYIGHNN